MLKNYIKRKENSSNSRERQMNVIKNNLKKRLSSLEKDFKDQNMLTVRDLDSLRSSTALGHTSNFLVVGNPTNDLKHHIQQRLSKERSKDRQSTEFRDD